jgi:hypothetical protein
VWKGYQRKVWRHTTSLYVQRLSKEILPLAPCGHVGSLSPWSMKSRHEGAIRILPEELLGFKNLLSFASHKWRVNRWLADSFLSFCMRLLSSFRQQPYLGNSTDGTTIHMGQLYICISITICLSFLFVLHSYYFLLFSFLISEQR